MSGLVPINEEPHEGSTASRKLRDVYDLFLDQSSARQSEVDPYGLKESYLNSVLQQSKVENSPSAMILKELLSSTNKNENTFEALEKMQ